MSDRLDRFAWMVFEDAARALLPHLDIAALYVLAGYMRPGSGGAWATVGADLAPRRDLLLADVAERGSVLLGGPWPFLNDCLPSAPDSLQGTVLG